MVVQNQSAPGIRDVRRSLFGIGVSSYAMPARNIFIELAGHLFDIGFEFSVFKNLT